MASADPVANPIKRVLLARELLTSVLWTYIVGRDHPYTVCEYRDS
jgi:hypothetical protein